MITPREIELESGAGETNAIAPATILVEMERFHIVATLQQHGGTVSQAALALGLARSTMYYELAELRITPRHLGSSR